MPKQKKERIIFDISDATGRVRAEPEEYSGRGADNENVANLLLLAILRELEAARKRKD